jgi:hypothetical protein
LSSLHLLHLLLGTHRTPCKDSTKGALQYCTFDPGRDRLC